MEIPREPFDGNIVELNWAKAKDFTKKSDVPPYSISEEEFVSMFVNNENRIKKYNNLLSWRSDFYNKGFTKYTMWFGGSFVSNKEFPGDIDVLTIFLRPAGMSNNKIWSNFVRKNSDLFDTKKEYGFDNIMIDGGYPTISNAKEISYWIYFLSHNRNKTMQPIYEVKFG